MPKTRWRRSSRRLLPAISASSACPSTCRGLRRTSILKRYIHTGPSTYFQTDGAQIEAGNTEADLVANESAFFKEATRLRAKYAAQIHILIGFECDWIRDESLSLIQRSLDRLPFEFFIGSVHHMHTIPIDYDRPMYERAREAAGGTDERLFEDYFDAQLDMLQKLRPPVIGHLDLIRLKSDDPNASFRGWPGVWARILRNLDYIAEYGGLVELNSAALRKGMDEPYPKGEICREFLGRGGRFCLSDDSHGVEQVALNFGRTLDFAQGVGIEALHFLQLDTAADSAVDARFPRTAVRAVSLGEARAVAGDIHTAT